MRKDLRRLRVFPDVYKRQTQHENAEVIGVECVKLGEGQGTGALSRFYGVAGAVVGLDEPVLIPLSLIHI